MRLRPALAALALALGVGVSVHAQSSRASAQAADCFDAAALFHGVNVTVLRAIAWHESRMRTWEQRRNSNGSVDVGLMQVNSVHWTQLAQHGVAPAHLQDACVNAYVGAWVYRQKVARHGNTWTAVGAYHSETPDRRDAYARNIHGIVEQWKREGRAIVP